MNDRRLKDIIPTSKSLSITTFKNLYNKNQKNLKSSYYNYSTRMSNDSLFPKLASSKFTSNRNSFADSDIVFKTEKNNSINKLDKIKFVYNLTEPDKNKIRPRIKDGIVKSVRINVKKKISNELIG